MMSQYSFVKVGYAGYTSRYAIKMTRSCKITMPFYCQDMIFEYYDMMLYIDAMKH